MKFISAKTVNKQFLWFYFFLFYVPHIFDFYQIAVLHEYGGDAANIVPVTLSFYTLLFIFIFDFAGFLFCIFLYKSLEKKTFTISSNISFRIDRSRLELFLIFIMLLNLFCTYKYNLNKAGVTYKGGALPALVSLINYSFFFSIYYFKYCNKRNKTYYFIVLFFLLLNIYQGWSGIVITLFMYEMFLDVKKLKKILPFSPLVLIIGGFVYSILWPFKNFIRTRDPSFLGQKLSIFDGILKLINRISTFSNTCSAYQFLDSIVNTYKQYNENSLNEIIGFFNLWTPRFVFSNKPEFFLNRIYLYQILNYKMHSLTVDDIPGSGNFGIVYFLSLFKINFACIVFSFVIIFLYVYFFKLLMDILLDKTRKFGGYLLLNTCMIYGGMMIRDYGRIVQIIGSFFILIFLGIIKIRVKNENSVYLY